jgi:PleD family two-component response regulator
LAAAHSLAPEPVAHVNRRLAGGGTLFASRHVMRTCIQTVVAVSAETQRNRFLGELLVDTNDYNVVVVESVERGYARVKQEQPDAVIVYLAIDDAAMCRLLSMLTLDPETSAIPIVTWTERFDAGGLDYFITDARRDSSTQPAAVPMN